MDIVAYYRTGNTNPGIRLPIDLGTDPVTDTARVLEETDVVTLILENQTVADSTALLRSVEVLTADPPVGYWKPEDGDLDVPGEYRCCIDITNADEDVETVPRNADNDYLIVVGAKPGDDD